MIFSGDVESPSGRIRKAPLWWQPNQFSRFRPCKVGPTKLLREQEGTLSPLSPMGGIVVLP